MSKRKEKRRDKAEMVCKEVRHQMAKYGGVVDNKKVCALILDWLKYSVKDSYKN